MPFQFQPYRSPLTDSIAERLGRAGDIEAQRAYQQGQIAANAAVQSGNAWSGAIRGIGETIGALPGQIEGIQASAQQRAQRAQQLELGALQLGEAQREQAGRHAVAGIMQGDQLPAGDVGPRQPSYLDENGLFDVPKITARLGAIGYGDQAPALVKGAEQINDSILKAQALKQQAAQAHTVAIGDIAYGTQKLTQAGTPIEQAMDFAVQPALGSGLIAPKDYARVKQQILSLPPEQQNAALTSLMDAAAHFDKGETLAEGAQHADRYGRITAKGAEKPPTPTELQIDAATLGTPQETPTAARSAKAVGIAQAPAMAGHEETARHNKEMERIANLTQGREAARDAELRRHNLATEGQNEAAPALTPDAINLTARQFAMTGQLPPMGMGKQGAKVRTDIINAAADQYKGLDLPSQVAAYKANQTSLGKLQQQRDAIGAFEQTASRNIDIFLDTAGKVVDTGSPLANKYLREASGALLGSPDQAAYDAARLVAVNEIAKITSNPNLTGVLSDSARKEVEAFNPQSATLAQTVKVMRVLKQDMQNRTGALDAQIGAIAQRIASPPGTVNTPSADLASGGTFTVTTPGGQMYTFPTQAALDAFKKSAGLR